MMWTAAIRRRMRQKGRGARSHASAALTVLAAIVIVSSLAVAFINLPSTLHLSQRCRMSRMWPSYIPYNPPSASGLNAKYRLFLYREAGPGRSPKDDEPRGRPALFIPGNAGSFGQVRSVASSAHHLFHSGQAGPDIGEVDWWTVDFNEDFSAFHGQTMQEQSEYLNEVVAFLLNKYPSAKEVPLLGHSMGGVVARLMMFKANYRAESVKTIITLSSPHAYPPVPLEIGVEQVYRRINSGWQEHAKDTLLISLSGGILDNQLSSEPASLPLARLWFENSSLSAFTSSLPGLWSGVDHLAMMWCDQLRERISRGVLRIEGRGSSLTERREAWRRVIGIEESGYDFSPIPLNKEEQQLPAGVAIGAGTITRFTVKDASLDRHDGFELITSQAVGLDTSFGPPIDQEAQIRVDLCTVGVDDKTLCRHVSPSAYDLYPPSPPTSQGTDDFPLFPVAEERYEVPGKGLRRLHFSLAELQKGKIDEVRVEQRHVGPADVIQAGWTSNAQVVAGTPSLGSRVVVPLEHVDGQPSTEAILSGMDSSLLAYDLSMIASSKPRTSCHSIAAPMLRVQSLSTGDLQFYPSVGTGSTYTLTLHSSSPFMPPASAPLDGTRFTLLLDSCAAFQGVSVQVNWRASAGLLLSRYRTTLASFPPAIVIFVAAAMWEEWDHGGAFPSLSSVTAQSAPVALPLLLAVTVLLSVIQSLALQLRAPAGGMPSSLVQDLLFGVAGSSVLFSATLALAFLTASYGLTLLVALSLDGLIAFVAFLFRQTGIKAESLAEYTHHSNDVANRPRSTLAAFTLLAVAITLVVPIQFVFLVLFLLQLFTTVCSSLTAHNKGEGWQRSRLNQQILLLNLYFWLLPLSAPVLIIWSRNLTRGWYGSLGGSDNNFLSVVGFLAVGQISSSGELMQKSQSRLVSIITQLLMGAFSIYTLAFGIRYTYSLFYFANVILAWLAFVHFRDVLSRKQAREVAKREERETETVPLMDLHSALPVDLDTSETVPDSLAASLMSQQGYTIDGESQSGESKGKKDRIRASKEADEETLLEVYLDLLDEYLACQSRISDQLSSGHFQLSKARMQLGRMSLNSGWDARMKARLAVRWSLDGQAALEKVKVEEEDEAAQEGVLIEDASEGPLRRRKPAAIEKEKQEDEGGERKGENKEIAEAKTKAVQPFDPLYQFAALPTPTLRRAQATFTAVLEDLVGLQGARGLLQIQSELDEVEGRIAALHTT